MKRGKRYQVQGRLHVARVTTKPGDCRLCGKPLPVPRRTAKRVCDECKTDPDRLERARQAKNKKERDRAAARLASRPAVIAICQHRDKDAKNGAICGVKFEPKHRVSKKDGVDRGVHPNQQYCAAHSTPAARLHRNSTREQRRVWALNYRNGHLDHVRQRGRKHGKTLRELARQGKVLAELRNSQSIAQEMIAIYLKLHPEATSNHDVRAIFGQPSDTTIKRARKLAKIAPPKGRPRKKLVKRPV